MAVIWPPLILKMLLTQFQYQKFLNFWWKGQLYQFTCSPNGLSICPRKFTKLLKPIFSTLRKGGHVSVGYIDDSWLMGQTFASCTNNVIDTLISFDEAGFVIHPEKSDILPSQEKKFSWDLY